MRQDIFSYLSYWLFEMVKFFQYVQERLYGVLAHDKDKSLTFYD